MLPFCDFVFGNDAEAIAFGEMKGLGSDIALIALKMSSFLKASGSRPRIVVITQGPGPTIVASNGKVHYHPVAPIHNELLVDVNGAGDAFVGGFLANLIQGRTESFSTLRNILTWIALLLEVNVSKSDYF